MKVEIVRNTFINGRPVFSGGVESVSDKTAKQLIDANKARIFEGDEKPSVEELRGMYAGRSVALLGGGPSLPDDLKKIEKSNPVLIGINHHAQLYLVKCDAVVFLDTPEKTAELGQAAQAAAIAVTPHGRYATHYLDIPHGDYGMTAGLGLWLAVHFGAKEIILCGMDCYSGTKPYFYDREVKKQHPSGVDDQVAYWKILAAEVDTPIKAVSGPLVKVFKPYRAPAKKTGGKGKNIK